MSNNPTADPSLYSGVLNHEGLDAMLARHAAELGEFFDAVVIIAEVQGENDDDATFTAGDGLYSARVQLCRDFVMEDATRTKIRVAHEEAIALRQEGGEMEGAQ